MTKIVALANTYQKTQNQDVFLIKTDSEITNANHLSLRFNRQTFSGVNFENGGLQSAPEHTGNSLVTTNTLSGVGTTVFSNSLFNEVRGQYAKDREPGQAKFAIGPISRGLLRGMPERFELGARISATGP